MGGGRKTKNWFEKQKRGHKSRGAQSIGLTEGNKEFMRHLLNSLQDDENSTSLQMLVSSIAKPRKKKEITVLRNKRLNDDLRNRISEELRSLGFRLADIERAERESLDAFSRFHILQCLVDRADMEDVDPNGLEVYKRLVDFQYRLKEFGLNEDHSFKLVCNQEIDLQDDLDVYRILGIVFTPPQEDAPDAPDAADVGGAGQSSADDETLDPAAASAAAEKIVEEQGALSAVYGEQFVIITQNLCRLNLDEFSLTVYYPEYLEYPCDPPLVLVSHLESPGLCLRTNYALQAELQESLCSEQRVFDSISWVMENKEDLKNEEEEEKSNLLKDEVEQESAPTQQPAAAPSRRKNEKRPKGPPGARSNQSDAPVGFPQLPHSADLKRDYESMLQKKAYKDILQKRMKLPAFQLKDIIAKTVRENQVTVISGETGSGKTTQIGQFILDDYLASNRGSECRIVCTQPRRIAAVSVAERVAQERADAVGQEVGYSVRLDAKYDPRRSQLLFFTTGVLLRRMHADLELQGVSHVIVDEIHERSLDSDFLLIILRELMLRRKDLKIILMSATLNADQFAQYFHGCPCLHIPGFTHPVQNFFLEDVVDMTNYRLDDVKESPYVLPVRDREEKGYANTTLQIIDESVVNYELIQRTVSHIQSKFSHVEGGILIFLPGILEISTLYDELEAEKAVILPLHSTLSLSEQSRVFEPVRKGLRKIVLSTNIAETSVTIDDIVFVIDTGKTKETRYDASSKLPSLVECWTSRAGVKQRTGRAGRVRPGYCFRMFSTHTFEKAMREYSIPEILRVPLENLCLQVQTLGFGAPEEFLKKAVDMPRPKAIRASIDTLCTIGAMDEKQNVTSLGYWIAQLPVDVRIGKMILYAAMFQCLDPILTMAAGLSDKSPFSAPFDARDALQRVKKSICDYSDHLILVHAYSGWRFSQVNKKENDYLRRHFLVRKVFVEMEKTKKQLFDLLCEIGFVTARDMGEVNLNEMRWPDGNQLYVEVGGARYNKNSCNIHAVKAVLVAGLYPNIVSAGVPAIATSSKKKDVKRAEAANGSFFKTRNAAEKIQLHPSSVLAGSKIPPSQRFLVYYEKMMTSQVYIRDVTPVSAFPLLFFASDVRPKSHMRVVEIDDWIHVDMEAKDAETIRGLREKLNDCLVSKISDPKKDIIQGQGALLIEAIIHVLSS
eukprot:ANDGO_08007.mRNA.1 DExH-box ATP-dependent RNA helicase DExH1